MKKKKILREFLSEHTSFTNDELKLICSCIRVEHLRPNEYFIQTGSKVCKLAFLVQGSMRAFLLNEKGVERTMYFILENHFFTDIENFYKQQSATLNIQASTKSTLLVLTSDQISMLSTEIPGFEYHIKHISEMMFIEINKMKDILLFGNAIDQYELISIRYPEIVHRVSNKHIASFLRITDQSMSRIMNSK